MAVMVAIIPLSTRQAAPRSEVEVAAVVAQQDDAVTGLELAAPHLQRRAGQLPARRARAARLNALASARVPASRSAVAAGGVGVDPRVDGGGVDVGGGVGEQDTAVGVVGVEGGGDVSVAQLVEGGEPPTAAFGDG